MKELVFQGENNQALTNSLLVAEKFGKKHYHVTKAEGLLNGMIGSLCVFTCDLCGIMGVIFSDKAEEAITNAMNESK